MAKHRALAGDGPLAGDPNLTVTTLDDRDWPREVIWRTGPGPEERHLYRFEQVALHPTTGGSPLYKFVRTLSPDDPDP